MQEPTSDTEQVPGGKRGLIVSRGWLQAVIIVVLLGFLVLGLLAYRTYEADPPIAAEASSTPPGRRALHGDDVRDGPAGVPATTG